MSLSGSVTVRTDSVEIIPSQKLELSLMDQDSRRRHFVSQPQTVATVAPLLLETHRVIPNQLFSLAPGKYSTLLLNYPEYTMNMFNFFFMEDTVGIKFSHLI